MNKCEKYFWNEYKIKDTYYGAKYSLFENWKHFQYLFFSGILNSIGLKIKKFKGHGYRIMNFMGIRND